MGEFCTSPEGMETLLMSLNFGNYFLHFDLFPPLRSSQAISLQCPGINSISSFASCSKTVALHVFGRVKGNQCVAVGSGVLWAASDNY